MADEPPQVGDRAQNAHGAIVTWDGQAWRQTAAPRANAGSAGRQDPQLATIRAAGDDAASVERTLNQVRSANARLQPGPWRGSFLSSMIPSEGDSMLGSLFANTVGGVLRTIGGITPSEVNDTQAIQRARNQAILHEQSRQHGVQTEGDAARMALTGVHLHNTAESNNAAIDQGVQQAIRGQARATFYTTWATRYGSLTSPNEQGASVDEVWNHNQPHIIGQFLQMRHGAPQGAPARHTPSIVRIR